MKQKKKKKKFWEQTIWSSIYLILYPTRKWWVTPITNHRDNYFSCLNFSTSLESQCLCLLICHGVHIGMPGFFQRIQKSPHFYLFLRRRMDNVITAGPWPPLHPMYLPPIVDVSWKSAAWSKKIFYNQASLSRNQFRILFWDILFSIILKSMSSCITHCSPAPENKQLNK